MYIECNCADTVFAHSRACVIWSVQNDTSHMYEYVCIYALCKNMPVTVCEREGMYVCNVYVISLTFADQKFIQVIFIHCEHRQIILVSLLL